MRDEHGVAPDAPQPRDDILRIADASAEQEELRLRRREREREFVIHAAMRVADHLVFIDDEELRAFAPDETPPLRLERRDDDAGIEPEREIAGGDADIPAALAPLGELVICERAGRHGEDGLPFQLRLEHLEDVGFSRARRRVHDDILPGAERLHGFLLPEVGDRQMLEEGIHGVALRLSEIGTA